MVTIGKYKNGAIINIIIAVITVTAAHAQDIQPSAAQQPNSGSAQSTTYNATPYNSPQSAVGRAQQRTGSAATEADKKFNQMHYNGEACASKALNDQNPDPKTSPADKLDSIGWRLDVVNNSVDSWSGNPAMKAEYDNCMLGFGYKVHPLAAANKKADPMHYDSKTCVTKALRDHRADRVPGGMRITFDSVGGSVTSSSGNSDMKTEYDNCMLGLGYKVDHLTAANKKANPMNYDSRMCLRKAADDHKADRVPGGMRINLDSVGGSFNSSSENSDMKTEYDNCMLGLGYKVLH